mmetsp:Transcript_4168/g.7631  ORF Transcript_4168/g.7631 Transcript_4168/m.7631 type:complete len:116 (+) Transcript_4168:832-1179(+)
MYEMASEIDVDETDDGDGKEAGGFANRGRYSQKIRDTKCPRQCKPTRNLMRHCAKNPCRFPSTRPTLFFLSSQQLLFYLCCIKVRTEIPRSKWLEVCNMNTHHILRYWLSKVMLP